MRIDVYEQVKAENFLSEILVGKIFVAKFLIRIAEYINSLIAIYEYCCEIFQFILKFYRLWH